jgi:phage replication-related protein YjqB (UPF0714/DUF867 family)
MSCPQSRFLIRLYLNMHGGRINQVAESLIPRAGSNPALSEPPGGGIESGVAQIWRPRLDRAIDQ